MSIFDWADVKEKLLGFSSGSVTRRCPQHCVIVLSLSKDQIQENVSIKYFTPVTLINLLALDVYPNILLLSFILNTTSLGGVGEWHRWVSGTGRAEKNFQLTIWTSNSKILLAPGNFLISCHMTCLGPGDTCTCTPKWQEFDHEC